MTRAAADLPPIRSARPAITAELMARTGLDEALLTDLVHRFYDKVRADDVLGPIFAERIERLGSAPRADGELLVVGRADDRALPRRAGAQARGPAGDLDAFRALARALPRDRTRDLPA